MNWIEVPIDVRAVVESRVPEQVKLMPTNVVRLVDDAFGLLGQMLAQECRAVREFGLAITQKKIGRWSRLRMGQWPSQFEAYALYPEIEPFRKPLPRYFKSLCPAH